MDTPLKDNLLKVNLADRIAAILQERIVAGAIAGDAPLRQDLLAAELGVSKIPLREAFAKLEQNGLVTALANRGYFVKPLTAGEAYDVFDLRLKIEPDLTARAAARADAAAVAVARGALESLNAAVAAASPRAGELNRVFHLALVQPAAAPVSQQMIERLHVIAERYVVQHLRPQGRSERARREHDELFAAWAAGDGDRVRDLSSRHIAATLGDLRKEFEG